MTGQQILEKLRSWSDPRNVEGMARYGIRPQHALGISMTTLRQMAKEIGKDHDLALELWQSGIHEARILATIIDRPELVTEEQLESWARDFDSWDVCDQACMNLFCFAPLAHQKAVEWAGREEEYIKRAAFTIMARLAVSSSKASDEELERFLPLIKREATDKRNYVKKAVNWALRQIGKHNLNLNRLAVETAKELLSGDSKSARWIASDALRELTGPAVQKRILKR
jgi:3-methyladenine DNA glycosylase AlkD